MHTSKSEQDKLQYLENIQMRNGFCFLNANELEFAKQIYVTAWRVL